MPPRERSPLIQHAAEQLLRSPRRRGGAAQDDMHACFVLICLVLQEKLTLHQPMLSF